MIAGALAPASARALAAGSNIMDPERAYLLGLLHDIDQQRRRTFTLRVVEGWAEEEIAMLQGRSINDVRKDVATVRSMLRERVRRAS